jgi:hypothetical protein
MRLCSCLWGGRFNPIIPVSSTLPSAWRREPYRELTGRGMADAFIRFFEPDVFVEAEKGLADQAGIKIETHALHDRVVNLQDFVVHDDHRRTDFAFGLNMFDAYRELYKREFQFVAKIPRQFVLFQDKGNSDAYCDAVFGMFPQQKELTYVRDAYVDVFAPQIKESSPKDCLELLENDYASALDVCNYQLEEEASSGDGPIIYVFDPTKTADL